MGGNINFGSRSEFLPGERSSDDMDIKYGRYGGCFVTYKKGFLYLVASLLFTAVVAYLVYYYGQYSSCRHDASSVKGNANTFMAELQKAAEINQQHTGAQSKISSNIKPSYYKLKIQPFLNETGTLKIPFEGQVSIVFQIDSPTKIITLNAKDLEIIQNEISLTHTTSKPEMAGLIAESQIKEENSTETNSANSTDISITTITPVNETESDFEAVTTLSPEHSDSNVTTFPEDSNSTLFPTISDSASNTTPGTLEPEMTTVASTSTFLPEIILKPINNNIEIDIQIYNEKDESYTIKLKTPLEKNIKYTLNMKFRGKISDGNGGILRSSYKQGNNTEWLVYTLLKPSYARTVFPCFDEPSLKAKFEIAIARTTNMKVVSNMHVNETYSDKNSLGWVWDQFNLTPLMSPHSVAFAVLPFNFVSMSSPRSASDFNSSTTSTKLWGRINETSIGGKYTLKVTPKLIGIYNKLFDYKYSLNKIDLVAIPNLPIGSYGSWGILFFSENELLVEENSSFEEKEHLLHSLSRELAQEWFGNLISVQSWSDSWLIEAISNYAHYIGMNSVEPDWDIMSSSFIFDKQEVLDIDGLDLLPKLTSISANFETDFDQQLLLAKKGSLLMNMLNTTLTESEFIIGIRHFVNKWKRKKFVQADFWDEFNSTDSMNLPSEIKLKDIVQLWINQKGYPLVTITNHKNDTLTIQQDKFSETQTPSIDLWIIPLKFISDSNSSFETIWLSEKSPKVSECQNCSWIFFTSEAPCRINYDLDNWNALIMLLRETPEALSSAHRAQLLDDAFHLARAGLLNYTLVLNMTLYLSGKELDIIPWMTVMKNFEYMDLILSKTANYGYFEDYVMSLIKPLYDKLIQNSSKYFKVVKLKKLIIKWACKFNYQPCKNWSFSQYDTWINSTNPETENNIPKDLRSTVYCMGVQNYGRSAWEFLWKTYEKVKLIPDESKALIHGMGCATESWLLMKYMSRALEEEHLQNSVLMWTSVSSELAINSAFEFLRENWLKVYEKYKNSELSYRKILHNVLGKLTSNNDLEQILEIFATEKSNLNIFAQDMIVIIAKLEQKLAWKKNYMATLNSWIQSYNKS